MELLTCSECGKTFKSKSGYEKHPERCRPKSKGMFQGYYCYGCGLRFPHGDNFEGHLARRHGVAISGEGSDGRLGRKSGMVEIIRNSDHGPAIRVAYRPDV